MRKCVIGIDLGTSSVKVLKKYRDGHVEKLRNIYQNALPLGWWEAIKELLNDIAWEEVEAIGLSSQVGTYIIDDEKVISWNSDVGKNELKWWKENYSEEYFLREISMPHPDIISYPLPRLKYIKEHFSKFRRIGQPKEYICEKLTGEWVTDAYSWRGLANLEKEEYSACFLGELSLEKEKLPKIQSYKEIAGVTKEIPLKNNTIPAGIPVFVGLNDYYAGLLGMGIREVGQMFDLTGTSEHLGVLQKDIIRNSVLVSGPYLEHRVHYGVTASSGLSIKYGLKLWNSDVFDWEKIKMEKPPIFLPYLKGERAPIWNADARGVFFGIEENCTSEMMAYAVMEGVVFSLYHIYEMMGKPKIDSIMISGGAAGIEGLNQLKAEVFSVPVKIVEENEVSALGVCMVAALGIGWYESLSQAAEESVKIKKVVWPMGQCHRWFKKRFEIYKELYLNVQPLYEKWKEI